jgi:hypothetical protein
MLLHYQPLCSKHVIYEKAVVSVKLHYPQASLAVPVASSMAGINYEKIKEKVMNV